MCAVSQNAACSPETAGAVDVFEGGETMANDLLGGINNPLCSAFLCAMVQLEYHTEMQYVSTLSMEQW